MKKIHGFSHPNFIILNATVHLSREEFSDIICKINENPVSNHGSFKIYIWLVKRMNLHFN